MKTKYIYYTPKFTPTDSQILKSANSKRNHILGLKVLGSLWKRRLLPRDLENHYLMTWLAYVNGNITKLSKTLGWHRNTLVLYLGKKLINLLQLNSENSGLIFVRGKIKSLFLKRSMNSTVGYLQNLDFLNRKTRD